MKPFEKFISGAITFIIGISFIFALYLNNGVLVEDNYEIYQPLAFDCSDADQFQFFYFLPNNISYVIKHSLDKKSTAIGKYSYSIKLGRYIGGNFWQSPPPYFFTPIFSIRYIPSGAEYGRMDYKLINKVGYGIQ